MPKPDLTPRIIGHADILTYGHMPASWLSRTPRLPLLDRMPADAARVLDYYGGLNRPVLGCALKLDWADHASHFCAVPTAPDGATFPARITERIDPPTRHGDVTHLSTRYDGVVSVYVVPEELPHVRAAGRLLRMAQTGSEP